MAKNPSEDRHESAQSLATAAFVWLAGDEALMAAFLDASGGMPPDLAKAVADPVFLGAVLDFLLAEDARVVAFCDAQGLGYEAPMRARMALPGGGETHWT